MLDPIDLNPDGPRSREHTAELGRLFDDCSLAITYATMSGKHGIEYPGDVYSLVAAINSATGRLPQVCEQVKRFLRAQKATRQLYEAKGESIPLVIERAAVHLGQAAAAARTLTQLLQSVQTDIAGLGVKETGPDA